MLYEVITADEHQVVDGARGCEARVVPGDDLERRRRQRLEGRKREHRNNFV